VKLILKVSFNLGAHLSATLMGVEKGMPNFLGGMSVLGDTLKHAYGLDPASFQFKDASGSESYAAPNTTVAMLAPTPT